MNELAVDQIMPLLSVMQEACQPLYDSVCDGNAAMFRQLYGDMAKGLLSIIQLAQNVDRQDTGAGRLFAGCRSCLDSLAHINTYRLSNPEMCLQKIEFELLPLLQEVYLQFYFFGYLAVHKDQVEEYYQNKYIQLCANSYIDEAIERGYYKYDVSLVVLGYNKLEYTRQCVESLLENLPQHLRYELIFINHGSTDGTREYFASKSPDKQLDISVNGGGIGAVHRITEGEFTINISNDVVWGHNAIENLVTCIRSDPQIAWAVPTTPNISNLQTIPFTYRTPNEFREFARANNHSNPFRWEQRVRLCDPISIIRNSIYVSSLGPCIIGHTLSRDSYSFPDDRFSLLLRRRGYKMMLVKDAYCHHFGGITLKGEVQAQGEQDYYLNGRKEFFSVYEVDPWGTGFCFAIPFLKRVVGRETGHVDILGINCGLGSNSLKIKEQLKEYCHNLDVLLCNITDERRFLADLRGVSDTVQMITNFNSVEMFLKGRHYQYIVWEDTFLEEADTTSLVKVIQNSLSPGGILFAKKNHQLDQWIETSASWSELGDQWFVYRSNDIQ